MPHHKLRTVELAEKAEKEATAPGTNVRKAESFVFVQQSLTETPASETVRMVLGTF
ncbi:MAG: hypothetical protein K2M66_04060 [Alistipes sp.]|nr:hypothetical protein [Alistipes sp.]